MRFPNDLSNGEKERLMENLFVPKSNCVFPITKKKFCYNCLVYDSWLAYSKIYDGAYCRYCVLFCNNVVTRKKKLVHLSYSDRSDIQTQFKRHVNAAIGIHSESMKIIQIFLMKWQLMWHRSMLKLFKKVKKPRKQQNFAVCLTFFWGVTDMTPNIIQRLYLCSR